MSVKPIVIAPDDILLKAAEPLKHWDADLATDLIDTLNVSGGIGLAAPQIGVSKRMLAYARNIYSPQDKALSIEVSVMMNPVIMAFWQAPHMLEEGCLSIPGYKVGLWRDTHIRVRYTSDEPEHTRRERVFSGITARILQHEIDHLEGILISNRAVQQRKLNGRPPIFRITA